MNNDTQTPREQLDLITSLVKDTRGVLENWSFPYLACGGVASAGTALSYLMAALGRPNLIMPLWITLTVCTEIAIFIQSALKANKRVTFASTRVIGALWGGIAAGIGGLWLVSMLAGKPVGLGQGLAVMSVLVAIGYLASGALARYRVMIILGIFWMIGGFACLLVPQLAAPMIVGAMSFLFEFVPGLILLLSERRTRASSSAGTGE